jgi:catechol 2,3-dioxygenase-like lactoylglutathione lyase family enzyme
MITFIYVADLNRSKIFYEDIMGFKLRLDQGQCRIVETNQKGGGLLGYCVNKGKSEKKSSIVITLVTSGVDDWYEYLLSRGVEITDMPKYNQIFKIYHFFFEDPDGHKLEIQEFRDPAWKE